MDRRILVVHEDAAFGAHIAGLIAKPGREIKLALDGTSALELLVDAHFDLAILAQRLPDLSGADIVREVAARSLPIAILVLGESQTNGSARSMLHLGATDVLEAPLDPAYVNFVIERALIDQALRTEADSAESRDGAAANDTSLIVGRAMGECVRAIERHAKAHSHIYIQGEPGTGKSHIARRLHEKVWHSKGPFVNLACGRIPEPLIDRALGDWLALPRGSEGDPAGGTLVLDSVDEMPASVQNTLAAALQGRASGLRSGARLVLLSTVDLEIAVERGTFRRELLDAAGSARHVLPPLRDRGVEDIASLVSATLLRMAGPGGTAKTVSAETNLCLYAYHWPGNVRELEDVVELLAVTAAGDEIQPDDLPPRLANIRDEERLLHCDFDRKLPDISRELRARVENLYLRQVLARYGGRVEASANHCHISRRALSAKMLQYDIDKRAYKIDRSSRRKRA